MPLRMILGIAVGVASIVAFNNKDKIKEFIKKEVFKDDKPLVESKSENE